MFGDKLVTCIGETKQKEKKRKPKDCAGKEIYNMDQLPMAFM